MTSDGTLEARWRQAVIGLSALASDSGRQISKPIDDRHFDNRCLEIEKDGVNIRLVRDRGSFLVDLGLNGRWHSFRNVYGFIQGHAPDQVAAERDRPVSVLARHWEGLLQALCDPALAAYEDAVGKAVLARLSSALVHEAVP